MFSLGHASTPPPTVALLAIGAFWIAACGSGAHASTQARGTPVQRAAAIGPVTPTNTPISGADSSLLPAVTKQFGLAASYVPPDLVPVPPEFTSSAEPQRLRRPAAEAVARMLTDARQAGIMLKVNSGYRSYEYQAAVLQSEIAAYGCKEALRQVALPGHSEHQLGLAADFTSASVKWDLSDTFAATPEGRWLTEHASAYGFVLSYPEGKEPITGYRYEPWHFRYVSPAVAAAIGKSGKTPTEYFLTLPGAGAAGLIQATADTASSAPCP